MWSVEVTNNEVVFTGIDMVSLMCFRMALRLIG